ncbi:Hypothetical predicted protein, partial [Pelobates cultripes]
PAAQENRQPSELPVQKAQIWRQGTRGSLPLKRRRGLNPKPAIYGRDTTPAAGSRRRRIKRQTPKPQRHRAACIHSTPILHPVHLQGPTPRPAQDLPRIGSRGGTVPKSGTTAGHPILPRYMTDLHSMRHKPANGTLGLQELSLRISTHQQIRTTLHQSPDGPLAALHKLSSHGSSQPSRGIG